MSDPRTERMMDLLADRALDGLTEAEHAELEGLLAMHPNMDADELDRIAAEAERAMSAAQRAGGARDEDMPDALRAAVAARGLAWCEETRGTGRGDAIPFVSPRRPMQAVLTAGGWIAAAACLALAAVLWWTEGSSGPAGGGAAAAASASLRRAALIATPPADLVRWNWTATDDPAARGAEGDVVWSNDRQEGYMRLRGLAANDPSREQYQLWIFDAQRPSETPVDGGVFDVDAATGEVVIPMDPKVRVFDATMFAVTVEKPGGVVVSKRERIPVLAKP
jgi:hypothetical protein